ncbi:MAG: flagellar basal body P-ring formation chaperone FlgA [Ketobacteraceae bacterium]|nr:flagellar basal body P-ring formation chaperone FlgA [Ketobacteraceae bacterium]
MKRPRKKIRFSFFYKCLPVFLWAVAGLLSPVHASGNKAIDQIEQQLGSFLESISDSKEYSRSEYEFTLPDERLNLAYCLSPLHIENRSPNRDYGRLTVRISCENADKPWSVNVSAKLKIFDKVVVSSRPIPKGSKIRKSMLALEEREVTRLHSGYFKDISNVEGAVSRFSLGGNRVIKPGNVSPPTLVTRGEKVVIHATTTGISIRASGIALSDGVLGEVVRVKNSQTKRIIEGRVSAAGQVTVSL